jgi:hypothetical protein
MGQDRASKNNPGPSSAPELSVAPKSGRNNTNASLRMTEFSLLLRFVVVLAKREVHSLCSG